MNRALRAVLFLFVLIRYLFETVFKLERLNRPSFSSLPLPFSELQVVGWFIHETCLQSPDLLGDLVEIFLPYGILYQIKHRIFEELAVLPHPSPAGGWAVGLRQCWLRL